MKQPREFVRTTRPSRSNQALPGGTGSHLGLVSQPFDLDAKDVAEMRRLFKTGRWPVKGEYSLPWLFQTTEKWARQITHGVKIDGAPD
jgi:hypothetical protein